MEEKVCPKCNNKRHTFVKGKGWVRCDCIDQIRADKIMAKSGFPESLWTLEMPDADVIVKMVNERATDKKPVFLHSESTKKDRYAAILARYTAIKDPSIETIAFIKLNTLAQRQFRRDFPTEDTIDPFKADITVLSIGDEITNKAHQNVLYTLLYDRLLAERFTIVSSFLPRNRIVQVYHKAVDDLMQENFKFYNC